MGMEGQTQYRRVGKARKDKDGLPQRHREHRDEKGRLIQRDKERMKKGVQRSAAGGKIGEFDYTAEHEIRSRSVHGKAKGS